MKVWPWVFGIICSLMWACTSASPQPARGQPLQETPREVGTLEAVPQVAAPHTKKVAEPEGAITQLPHGGELIIIAKLKVEEPLSNLLKQDFAPKLLQAKVSKETVEKAEQLNRKAKALTVGGQLSQAENLYMDALRVNPGHIMARYNLATLYVRLDKHDRALSLLHEIVALPDCDECRIRDLLLTDEKLLPIWGPGPFRGLILKYFPGSLFIGPVADLEEEGEIGTKGVNGFCGPGETREGAVDEDGDGMLVCTKGGKRSGRFYAGEVGYDLGEGMLATRGNYRAGKKHGRWSHVQSFEESWQGSYRDGKRHGWWRTVYALHDTSYTRYEAYVNGRLEGTSWTMASFLGDEPERIILRVEYSNGVKHGLERRWHLDSETRVLIASGSFDEGKKNGSWLEYAPGTGHPTALNTYVQGRLEGPYRYWTAEGKQLAAGAITNGAGHYLRMSGAKIVESGEYRDGLRVGKWTGTAGSGPYRRGKRSGRWMMVGATWQATGNFKHGKRSGSWSYHDSSGTMYAKGKFRDDIAVGKWVSPAGEIVFKNGELFTVAGESAENSEWYYDENLFLEKAKLGHADDL